ncbi:MAG: hypothetical protein ACMG6S_05095, partial [Byssovorax sp.]
MSQGAPPPPGAGSKFRHLHPWFRGPNPETASRPTEKRSASQAEILAQRGHLDKDRVAKIRANSGKYDKAKDGVDLVELYAEKAASLKGLHPFTQAEL